MKYSVPILLALRSQDTEVNCKWTSQAIYCESPVSWSDPQRPAGSGSSRLAYLPRRNAPSQDARSERRPLMTPTRPLKDHADNRHRQIKTTRSKQKGSSLRESPEPFEQRISEATTGQKSDIESQVPISCCPGHQDVRANFVHH
jgi:hypothetical protein